MMDEGDTAPVVGEGVFYIKRSLVQSNLWMEQVIFSVILDKKEIKRKIKLSRKKTPRTNKNKKKTIFL